MTTLPPLPPQLQFEDDLLITKMFSAEGEVVPLSQPLYPTGNVEDWLLEVERVMMDSIRKILGQSLLAYPEVGSRWFSSPRSFQRQR